MESTQIPNLKVKYLVNAFQFDDSAAKTLKGNINFANSSKYALTFSCSSYRHKYVSAIVLYLTNGCITVLLLSRA